MREPPPSWAVLSTSTGNLDSSSIIVVLGHPEVYQWLRVSSASTVVLRDIVSLVEFTTLGDTLDQEMTFTVCLGEVDSLSWCEAHSRYDLGDKWSLCIRVILR